MKKHYATHVEDTDKLISVAGPILEYETWYELFPSDMKIDGEEITEPTYPFPVYTSPSLEFSNLLASEEWSSNEEEYDI